ncbi:hypothetical protein R83H12_01552 [Fibrobacteria bacterium R8-3-H12]
MAQANQFCVFCYFRNWHEWEDRNFVIQKTHLRLLHCKSNWGGVISDTTAIILRSIIDRYVDEGTFGQNGGSTYRQREFSLNLVDIRFEKIYWKKDINIFPTEGNYSDVIVELIDSVLFLHAGISTGSTSEKNYRIGRIAVVHIDEKFHQSKKIELRIKDIELKGEGWKYGGNIKVRPWKDGLILAYSGDDNPYALLDTAAGTMELWQPNGEFEWLNECADYKWSQIGGLCLNGMPDTSGFVLLRNGIDTLAIRYANEPPVKNSWNIWNLLLFNGNIINSGGWIYSISQQGQVSEKPLDVWGRTSVFTNSSGDTLVAYIKR